MNPRSVILAIAMFVTIPVGVSAQEKTPSKAVCPYVVDHAASLDAKIELVTQADDHTQYRVEFNGIKKDRVPAFLYVPKRGPGDPPAPAILLQYGSGGNKKTDYIVAIGKQFVSRGFVVLTIDSPGTGERRPKDNKQTNGVFGMIAPDRMLHYCSDYSRAVDYLETRTDVNKDRIGYVGVSWGAITGITYVAHDPRIKAMGSMVGGGNFLLAHTPETALKLFHSGAKSSDPVVHVAHIAPRPLLFINVTKDQLIMKPWAESLHKSAGAGSKVVWLECDHFFRGVDRVEVCNSVIDFMADALAKSSKK